MKIKVEEQITINKKTYVLVILCCIIIYIIARTLKQVFTLCSLGINIEEIMVLKGIKQVIDLSNSIKTFFFIKRPVFHFSLHVCLAS